MFQEEFGCIFFPKDHVPPVIRIKNLGKLNLDEKLILPEGLRAIEFAFLNLVVKFDFF